MSRHINQAGLDLVKEFEGYSSSAYLCPAGVWTIGWGSTRGVEEGMVIALEEAEARLSKDLEESEQAVERLVETPLNDNQFSALVSFVFNVGQSNFARSTLLRMVNKRFFRSAADQFLRWTKVDGKELAGLVRRRKGEVALWNEEEKPC